MTAEDFKKDFPILQNKGKNGKTIAYLDNAATTQKPRQVIDAVCGYYENYNANPHRGTYSIAEKLTQRFEEVREQTAGFIGAASPREIVFTAGTTDAINMAALMYGSSHINAGDEILLSITEHHSNLLPWQRLAKEKNAELIYLYPDKSGRITASEVEGKCSSRTRIAAITLVSNVLGAVNPIAEIAKIVHSKGGVLFVDGAQGVPHIPVNVQLLDVDFLTFSGHKMLAPAGIGVLYGKSELLQDMPPLRVGGGNVEYVSKYEAEYMDAPWRFEAGTQNAEGVIGFGAAMEYIRKMGFGKIQEIERQLLDYTLRRLKGVPGIVMYGINDGADIAGRTGILAFNIKEVHPHDTATILAQYGVAVRAGHHCAQPLMQYLGVNSTCRMSLYFYNTKNDIDRMVDALSTVREVLGYGA